MTTLQDETVKTTSNPKTGEDGSHRIMCTICEPSCGLVATVNSGEISKLGPDKHNPHSLGHVCVKGTSATGLVYNQDRILTPLKAVDKQGKFEPVSWEEALSDIASRTKSCLENYGSEAFGSYLGNPIFFATFDFFAINAFLGALQCRKGFTAISQDNLARLLANEHVYGKFSEMPLPDLDNCDLLIVFGSNMLVSNGSMMTTARIRDQLEAIHSRGRVVVIDPRRTETAQRYEHLGINVSTDIWMLSAMLNVMFSNGWADEAYLKENVTGWKELRQSVANITPSMAENWCGVPADEIIALTKTFCETPRAAIASRTGIARHEFATLSTVLVDALNIVGGKFSREGGIMIGHRAFAGGPPEIPDSQSRIGGFRTVNGGWMPSIVMAKEITEPGPDRLRTMFMIAGNPVSSGPGGEELEAALKSLDLFVSCDLFVNDSNRFADYILPTTTFLERSNLPFLVAEGMLTPTLQYSHPVIDPIGDSRREEAIFGELMQRVFGQGLPPMEMIIDQMLKEGPYGQMEFDGISGLSLEALKERPGGVKLPEIDIADRCRAALKHKDGKLHVWHENFENDFERLSKVKPPTKLRLFGRRDMRSMNSWLHNVERLVRSQKPTLLIHPDDAARHNIETGMKVSVSNKYGEITVEAEVSDEVRTGSVNYPHGWGHKGGWKRAVEAGGGNVNLLSPTDIDAVEPVSGISVLDGIEVDIRPAPSA